MTQFVPAPRTPVRLVPTPLDLNLQGEIPTWWFADNPFLTHYMNAFSGVLPEGERFMIDSVRSGRDQVRGDQALQQEISGFIGQEAYHARAHRAFNNLMQTRGLPFDRLEGLARWTIRLLQRLPEKDRMAMTGAVEHFTAIFGQLMLEHPEIIEQAHPKLRPLLVWHSIEELEHKAVAFDLFTALGGGYWRRVEGLLLATAVISVWTLYGQLLFMWSDRSLFNLRATAKGLWWMFGVGPRAGYFRKTVGQYLDFFRPGHHPAQEDSEALLALWRPRLQEMLARPA